VSVCLIFVPYVINQQTLRDNQQNLQRFAAELEARKAKVSPQAAAELAAATSAVQQLEAQAAELDAYRREVQRRGELETEMLRTGCQHEVAKAALAILTAFVKERVGGAFNAVLDTAAAFTDGLLLSRLQYNADGELGRTAAAGEPVPGAWIPWETFSGTEELIAFAGLSVALASQAPFKLVVMDELGRLTPKRKAALVEAGRRTGGARPHRPVHRDRRGLDRVPRPPDGSQMPGHPAHMT